MVVSLSPPTANNDDTAILHEGKQVRRRPIGCFYCTVAGKPLSFETVAAFDRHTLKEHPGTQGAREAQERKEGMHK